MLSEIYDEQLSDDELQQLLALTQGNSAVTFVAILSELKAQKVLHTKELRVEDIIVIMGDHIPPAIERERLHQTL
jgi:hypothetical protein